VVAAPVGCATEVSDLLAAQIARATSSWTWSRAARPGQLSVASALAAAPSRYVIVLVHDAARAFAPADLVERVAEAVRAGHHAVVPVLPVIDTIKQVDESGPRDRQRSTARLCGPYRRLRASVVTCWKRGNRRPWTRTPTMPAWSRKLGVRVFGVPGAEAALKIHPAGGSRLRGAAAARRRRVRVSAARPLGSLRP